MRAEDQSLLVQDAQGQQTVQCLFVQPGKRQLAQIHNIVFEKNDDGLFAYVYNGTFEGYQAFKQIMEQHGVYPAHEIPGAPSAETDEPTVQTDPGKTETDTLTNPVEIEADDAVQGSESSDNRQSEAGSGDDAQGQSGSDNAGGSGPVQSAGGDQGGEAPTGNGAGPVSTEVAPAKPAKPTGKGKTPTPDPFEL